MASGLTPLIAAWLVSRGDGSLWLVSVYASVVAVISLVSARFLPETAGRDLDESWKLTPAADHAGSQEIGDRQRLRTKPAPLQGMGSVERVTTNAPAINTLGQLRASGHQQKTLREELRDNLLDALREGRDPWPGLHGFGTTVIPQLERALLAGHDVVLLGERGQGKTRLLRTLVGLLDEWTPVIAGAELGEHPYEPITHASQRRAVEEGDDLRVDWRHRDDRYAEKLATPDTSVADLIGDVDPMKVAEGRSLGDPETIHFGLIPRSHRGIVAINELPDLAERIQVAMLNVMEERDIQIRGYVLRLPLDTLVVASANPEDYTNRGRIITPLKDRFGAEIRTHYPIELEDEVAVILQEADLVGAVPDHLVEILARFTRALRESSSVDQRSGVSARFAIAGAETIAAAALHRATVQGEDEAVARVVDLETAVDVLGGKIEFETGEEGRETAGARAPAPQGDRRDGALPARRRRPRAAGAGDRAGCERHHRRAGHRASTS